MTEDFRDVANRTISDAKSIQHKLIEKALAMRCLSYMAQIKSQLLTDTIFEIDSRKKVLSSINTELEKEILERKRIEKKLIKARDEAEEATKLKDKFVTLVTHDLNTPLHIVYGNLQLLQLSGDTLDNKNDLIENALTACTQMASLISDILSMSRIKSGKLQPRLAKVNVGNLLNSAILFFRAIADEKGIQISNHVTENVEIYADERLLSEVINNLLSNAIKFCDHNDTIRFDIESGESTEIIISDTGIGIKAEHQDNLFHFDNKHNTKGTIGESGSGFGLPLAYEIIAAHGGVLTVDSEPGKGTSFRIKLPQHVIEGRAIAEHSHKA